ncbi:acyl-CoA dehydrogenase [Bradyrhizobium sp. cir1]|uniref:acyl-CoA dehydrogenase family protein n=1 Tax=Bradyrhizobium sp. cir1 TaxID=1445730 RepID=UPI00183AD095|nr:acyl-CoA dehydrogenase family protein [Bradyrhizobium sp. cir1]MBB4371069.1 acyl-CoA dehydrogenase [Bradyrhizobium sp. cir1]
MKRFIVRADRRLPPAVASLRAVLRKMRDWVHGEDMDLSVTEEITAIGDAVVRFIDREVAAIERDNHSLLSSERQLYDASGRYAPEVVALRKRVRMRSAELGFYNLFGPTELGGEGMGAVAAVEIQERVNAHVGPSRHLVQTVVLPSPFTNGLSPVLVHLDRQVFERYRGVLASGEKTMCFGLSEPDAGSDVFGMKTRAVRDGDGWVITGTKQWITNAPHADYAMIFAVTNEDLVRQRKGGITGFFIETSTSGFSVPSVIPTMGHLGSETGIISLDHVRVPDGQRLGAIDDGLSVAIGGVSVGRLAMAGSCIGLARWALRQAVDYAAIRKTGGRPIAGHQAIQMMIARCATDIYAAKSMTRDCAWRIDQGLPATKQVSMVKMYATEMLNRVMDQCIQVHGAMGLSNELRLEAGYRWARLLRIPDGTTEIQLRTIARYLLAGDLE